MSILIKDMEMPTVRDTLVLIQTNGAAIVYEDEAYMTTAASVPPHGRLIDADALIVDLMDRGVEGLQTDDWHEIQQAVEDAPTIIEAEGEDDG